VLQAEAGLLLPLRDLGAQRYRPGVAKEARKLKRATERQDGDGKSKKKLLKQPVVKRPDIAPEMLGKDALKKLVLRLSIPVLGAWLVGGLIASVVQSSTGKTIAIGVPAVITVVLTGIVIWALGQAKRARGVASILSKVESAEDRKAALAELESQYKKKDPAAVFARAQLELQEDPRKALETLETIQLGKVLAPVADEARAQRGLIHLMLGEVAPARQLVDGIELTRHQEPRVRAMMASVIAEAWARSGQAKKAIETLTLFDPDDAEYEQLRPQLWRAYAYAYAHTSNLKGMRRALRKLLELDVRLLGSFFAKKTHPLLQKEAKKLVEQSGQVPKKMIVQRR
jgi:hypothetical protein